MTITQAVRDASTEQQIYLSLTAYLIARRLGDELRRRSTLISSLPFAGRDDARGDRRGCLPNGVWHPGRWMTMRAGSLRRHYTFSARN